MATAVKIEQLAKVLNLTPRRVQQLVGEGMPRSARGAYDLGNCMSWYIRYLQKALETRSSGTEGSGITNLMTQRTRQAQESAERMQMANLKARGEVVLIADVQQKIQRAISFLGQDFDSVAQRVTTDEALQLKIEDELQRARARFADHLESLASGRSAVANGRARDSKARAPNAGGVGRPVPIAAARVAGAGAVAK